jgi:acyl-CoA synthetase (AMP-forming)/AMP-acid ligase II
LEQAADFIGIRNVETVLDDIGRKHATDFAGVPTMWIGLLNHPKAGECDYSSLRFCASGGSPLPFEVKQKVSRLIGQPLRVGWGMTETSPAGTLVPNGAASSPGDRGLSGFRGRGSTCASSTAMTLRACCRLARVAEVVQPSRFLQCKSTVRSGPIASKATRQAAVYRFSVTRSRMSPAWPARTAVPNNIRRHTEPLSRLDMSA